MNPASVSILIYPDPALRRRAERIETIDDDVRTLAARMIDLMHEAPGIGLAATQVGVTQRLFVADVPTGDECGDGDGVGATQGPIVYVNPVLSEAGGPYEPRDEGCLSLPDIHGDIVRPSTITITAQDLEGGTFIQHGAGLLARCWQHEVDHLDGVLILDRMVQLHRMRNRSAVRALERQHTP